MKALSIRQPWAWLIVNGYKDVENRTWDKPKSFELPQRIHVHAGLNLDYGAFEGDPVHRRLKEWVRELIGLAGSFNWDVAARMPAVGVIVGEVTVTTWADGATGIPWFTGPYGLILCDPVAYKRAIPYKGRLGFFDVQLDPMI